LNWKTRPAARHGGRQLRDRLWQLRERDQLSCQTGGFGVSRRRGRAGAQVRRGAVKPPGRHRSRNNCHFVAFRSAKGRSFEEKGDTFSRTVLSRVVNVLRVIRQGQKNLELAIDALAESVNIVSAYLLFSDGDGRCPDRARPTNNAGSCCRSSARCSANWDIGAPRRRNWPSAAGPREYPVPAVARQEGHVPGGD